MNPNFFVTLGVFTGAGYLINGTDGAIFGAVCMGVLSIIVQATLGGE